MEVEAKSGAAVGSRRKARACSTSPRGAPEFPGCRPMRLRCDEVANCKGRFEFWDAAIEDDLAKSTFQG